VWLPGRIVTLETVLLESAIEAIGSTPLVSLARFAAGHEGMLLAKLEFLNPGYSKKDRIARQIILDAENDGVLSPGQPVVELTSGNTGTGLAIVCAVRGYPFIAVMSAGNSPERARMMAALGAEVVLVPQAPGSLAGHVSGGDLALVEQVTQQVARARGAFRADQFHHAGNFRAHYLHTGPEILRQAGRPVDAFCDFVGTGGSFGGCAAALKEANSATRCYVVEPAGAAVLSGQAITDASHRIQGGGYSMAKLDFIRPGALDGYLEVTDQEAIAAARRLARTEGLFCGFSSGANIAAALKLLDGPCRGETVVTLLNDSGLKYLSTDLHQ
jgi:cysteine synthase A